MAQLRTQKDYFEWMFDLVCKDRFAIEISYRKLLTRLNETEFTYIIPMDVNRAHNGIDLRYRFAYDTGRPGADTYLDGPCSVLEMMIALAIKCEEVMDDAIIGDRTGQWFWQMVTSLGLGGQMDDRFDIQFVDETLERFLNREYAPNGKGGLFYIRNTKEDLRDIEIWGQLHRYLNTLI